MSNPTSIPLDSVIWQRYGVDNPPFSPHVNFNSFYRTEHWLNQYQVFKDYISSGQSPFLLISGSISSGRHSLIEQMIHQARFQGKIIRIAGQNDTTFEKITDAIINKWANDDRTAPEDTSKSISSFDQLLEHLEHKKTRLIVFNQANRLSLTIIARIISAFTGYYKKNNKQSSIKVVFIADDDFLQTLYLFLTDSLNSFVTAIKLENLTKLETEKYLQHRMHSAGLDPRYQLRPNVVDQLFRRSNGKTSNLNNLIMQYLPGELLKKAVTKKYKKVIKYKRFQEMWLKVFNKTIFQQGVWLLGVSALGYTLIHYQSQLNLGRFIVAQKYGGMLLPAEHRLRVKAHGGDIFQSNSGYSLDYNARQNVIKHDFNYNKNLIHSPNSGEILSSSGQELVAGNIVLHTKNKLNRAPKNSSSPDYSDNL